MSCITFSLLKRRLAKINCALRVFRRLRWVLLSAKISGTDIQEMNKRTIACVGAKKTRSDLSRGAHFKRVQRYRRHLTFWLMHNVTSFYHLRGRMRKRRCHSIRALPNETSIGTVRRMEFRWNCSMRAWEIYIPVLATHVGEYGKKRQECYANRGNWLRLKWGN